MFSMATCVPWWWLKGDVQQVQFMHIHECTNQTIGHLTMMMSEWGIEPRKGAKIIINDVSGMNVRNWIIQNFQCLKLHKWSKGWHHKVMMSDSNLWISMNDIIATYKGSKLTSSHVETCQNQYKTQCWRPPHHPIRWNICKISFISF